MAGSMNRRLTFLISCVVCLAAWAGYERLLRPTAFERTFDDNLRGYPFAAEMFRQGDIPKRLIPGTIALGAFTFTMDALPGTPQIQNIIPTTFFKTTTYAAAWLGTIGAIFKKTVPATTIRSASRGVPRMTSAPKRETSNLLVMLVAIST